MCVKEAERLFGWNWINYVINYRLQGTEFSSFPFSTLNIFTHSTEYVCMQCNRTVFVLPFIVRLSMLNTEMHFCMSVFHCFEIDCICEQTKQTFVSLKYSINTFPLPLNSLKTAAFFKTSFTIVPIGFNGNFRRYTWASRNVIKPKHYKTNMQFRYLLLSCCCTCWKFPAFARLWVDEVSMSEFGWCSSAI